jgi:hypothetical protein
MRFEKTGIVEFATRLLKYIRGSLLLCGVLIGLAGCFSSGATSAGSSQPNLDPPSDAGGSSSPPQLPPELSTPATHPQYIALRAKNAGEKRTRAKNGTTLDYAIIWNRAPPTF